MASKVKYTNGYSKAAFSSQGSRTAESEAKFLLPYIQPDFRILDFGCGPGTISASLAKYVSEGQVVAVDISSEAIAQAKNNSAALPDGCPTNLEFYYIDVLKDPTENENSKGPDEGVSGALPVEWLKTFDIVCLFATHDYDVHTCTYLPDPTGHCAKVGITLAKLNSAGSSWTSSGLARDVPDRLTQDGFPPEKMAISGSTIVHVTPEARKWWGENMAARYDEGDPIRECMIRRDVLSAAVCTEIGDALLAWSRELAGMYFWTAVEVVVPVRVAGFV